MNGRRKSERPSADAPALSAAARPRPVTRMVAKFGLRGQSGRYSLFLSVEAPQLPSDGGAPFSVTLALPNASMAACVVDGQSAIPPVFSVAAISEIGKSVVGAVSVNMVNLSRLFSCLPFPRDSRCHIVHPVNAAVVVAEIVNLSEGALSGISGVPTSHPTIGRAGAGPEHFDWARLPHKQAGSRVVVEKLAQQGLVRQGFGIHGALQKRCDRAGWPFTRLTSPTLYSNRARLQAGAR